MIEQEIAEGVTFRIDVRLAAEAGGFEERESLQGPQGSLAFRHRYSRAGNWKDNAGLARW